MKQSLSQSDLQRIERMLSTKSRTLQMNSMWNKSVAVALWNKCYKVDPNTDWAFRELNAIRTELRINKTERKNIDRMIQTVRKMIRSA